MHSEGIWNKLINFYDTLKRLQTTAAAQIVYYPTNWWLSAVIVFVRVKFRFSGKQHGVVQSDFGLELNFSEFKCIEKDFLLLILTHRYCTSYKLVEKIIWFHSIVRTDSELVFKTDYYDFVKKKKITILSNYERYGEMSRLGAGRILVSYSAKSSLVGK